MDYFNDTQRQSLNLTTEEQLGRLLHAISAWSAVILGVTGNTLSLAVYIFLPPMRTTAHIFIINAEVIDLLLSIGPTYISMALICTFNSKTDFFTNAVVCQIFPAWSYTFLTAQSMALVGITLNRYTCIVHPRFYSRRRRLHVGLTLALVWGVSIIQIVPAVTRLWGRFQYNERLHFCAYATDTESERSYAIISSSLPTGLAISTFLYCYPKIYYSLKKSQAIFRRTSFKRHDRQKKRLVEHKILVMGAIVCLLYTFTMLPWRLIIGLDPGGKNVILRAIGNFLLSTNVWCNCIVYSLSNPQWRKAYSDILTCNACSSKKRSSREAVQIKQCYKESWYGNRRIGLQRYSHNLLHDQTNLSSQRDVYRCHSELARTLAGYVNHVAQVEIRTESTAKYRIKYDIETFV